MQEKQVLGIDVGASGIKGGVVDLSTGEIISERLRLPTPQPSEPEAVAETFAELVKMHKWSGLVGCGFPAIVKKGVAYSAANIDSLWMGEDIEELFSDASGCQVKVLNDADAAGIAEIQFGAGKGRKGTVLLITIGSGLGTALFVDGHLAHNTEFGHIFFRNMVAEHYAANSVRKGLDLSWEDWAGRFDEYLHHIDRILSPDLIILGGGVSKNFSEYKQYLTVKTRVIPATLRNDAGAVGAAYFAYHWFKQRS